MDDYKEWLVLTRYLTKEWLSYKEEQFNFFLKDVMHFGVYVNSSNEGAHGLFKKHLYDRTGDLLTVVKAVHAYMQM